MVSTTRKTWAFRLKATLAAVSLVTLTGTPAAAQVMPLPADETGLSVVKTFGTSWVAA